MKRAEGQVKVLRAEVCVAFVVPAEEDKVTTVIKSCFVWRRKVRAHHPRLHLGHTTLFF